MTEALGQSRVGCPAISVASSGEDIFVSSDSGTSVSSVIASSVDSEEGSDEASRPTRLCGARPGPSARAAAMIAMAIAMIENREISRENKFIFVRIQRRIWA